MEHRETCLKVNGKQTVNLKSSSIGFKDHSKQLAVPFKCYVDFECNVKGVQCLMLHTLKNIKMMFLADLLIKLFVLVVNLVNQLFFREEKMQFIYLLKQFLKKKYIDKK